MEIPMDLKSMANPVHRLIVGILFAVLGILCVTGQDMYSGITRESCTQVTAVFKDCKYRSTQSDHISNNIYLIFEDYDDLDIHSSCAGDELIQKLFDLEKGAVMEMLITDKNIYELKVNGETWLDFNTAKASMEGNLRALKYVGYVFIPFGALCAVTAVIHFIVRAAVKTKKKS